MYKSFKNRIERVFFRKSSLERRRLEKTFNLVDEWSQTNLKNHPHATEKVAEKDNKERFQRKELAKQHVCHYDKK